MLEVVHGAVPERLPGARPAVAIGPIHQVAAGRVLLELPGIARVLVEAGERALVEPAPGAGAADVEWLLAGPVRQVAWLQRGTLALRAAAVAFGDHAVALIGGPASGKSFVAAALALRGRAVIADAALPVDESGGEPIARAVSAELELWPDAAAALGLDPAAGRAVRPRLRKRAHAFAAGPTLPLAAIVVLERRSRQDAPVAEPRHGAPAAQLVGRATAMAPVLDGLGMRPAHLRWAAWLAAAVPVLHLKSDRHHDDVAAVADAVEAVAP
jgi:hypothetical protein